MISIFPELLNSNSKSLSIISSSKILYTLFCILFSTSEREGYNYLIELHSLAKRAYFKVDETFKTIFKELDSDKTIGTERKDDDLPF